MQKSYFDRSETGCLIGMGTGVLGGLALTVGGTYVVGTEIIDKFDIENIAATTSIYAGIAVPYAICSIISGFFLGAAAGGLAHLVLNLAYDAYKGTTDHKTF